jgi:hypothetical protein
MIFFGEMKIENRSGLCERSEFFRLVGASNKDGYGTRFKAIMLRGSPVNA